MIRAKGGIKRIVLASTVLLTMFAAGVGRAQQPASPTVPKDAFLGARVPEFRLHNQTLLDALWQLARGPAPFGFGFEHVLQRTLKGPPVPKRLLTLHLEHATVRQILDALCRADPRFTWSTDGATVDVYPRDVVGDPSYLLNRRIPIFALRDARRVEDGLFAIPRQLPPPTEQVAVSQVGGSDPYPPTPWNLTLKDVTVRQVVNRLAAHGGVCAVWIFGGAEDFRAFGFFNTNLCGKKTPQWIRKILRSRRNAGHP